MASDEIRITIRLPGDLHQRIKHIAQEQDRSLNWQIVRLLQTAALSVDTGRAAIAKS